MKKTIIKGIRMTPETHRQLQKLSDASYRSESDVIRYLIAREYALLLANPQPYPSILDDPAIDRLLRNLPSP